MREGLTWLLQLSTIKTHTKDKKICGHQFPVAQSILVIDHLRVYTVEHLKSVLMTILGFFSDQESGLFVRIHRKDNILCLYSAKVRMH